MKRRLFAAITCILLCLAVLPGTASADAGPKPAVTVHVVNAPEGTYYLDLLITDPDDYENIDPAEQRSIMIPLTGEGSSIADVYIDGSLYQSFEVNFEEGTSSLLADNKDNF